MARDMSFGSKTSDLVQSRSLPGTLFMRELGSRSSVLRCGCCIRLDLDRLDFFVLDVDVDVDVDVESRVFVLVENAESVAVVDEDNTLRELPVTSPPTPTPTPIPRSRSRLEGGRVELFTTTAQSCNSCSPCSSKSVEKRWFCFWCRLSFGWL